MTYWNPSAECMDREEMTKLQNERLVKTVEKIYHNVPHYREKMQKIGLEPGDIKGIQDLHMLPFTTKQDLRDTYPFGLFASPMNEIIRIHSSSGTTGKPTVVGYTKNDLDAWTECCARVLHNAGATKDSVVQVSYGYGLLTGGLGMHYGTEKIGATVVPASGGNTRRQLQILTDFGVDIICCTPSYANYIFEELLASGVTKDDIKLKAGIFGAEMWTENMRKQMEELLDIKAIDIYGLSEITGPGVSFDCHARKGLHVNEDYFIPEIIDPDTGEVLPYDERGELVFSTISKEGFPLLRYRTKDLSTLSQEKCDCGRTLVRMGRVMGRSDDMLIIRGVNVFPSQVESVLLEMGETAPHYLLIVDREGKMDNLEIQVEMSEQLFSDKVKNIESLEHKLKHSIESLLGVSAKIRLVNPKTIERSEGKAKRVIDKRKFD